MGFNILESLTGNKDKNFLEREQLNNRKEVVYLKIYELESSEENFYSMENIDDLKNSIELNGVINPVTVAKKDKNSKYRILAGHKRTMACNILVDEGKKEFEDIPVIIMDLDMENEDDYLKAQLILIQTNSTARVLTDFEKMEQAKKTKEILLKMKDKGLKGNTRSIISELLNLSNTQIARYEMIDKNLNKELKTEFEKGNIGVSAAYELSRKDRDKQSMIYDDYRNGETSLSIKEVKNIRDNDKAIIKAIQEECKEAAEENEEPKVIAEFKNYEVAENECRYKEYSVTLEEVIKVEKKIRLIIPDEINSDEMVSKFNALAESRNTETAMVEISKDNVKARIESEELKEVLETNYYYSKRID